MRRKTKEQFVKESQGIHKNFYTYDKVLYKNAKTKVEITCPIHGSFWQTPIAHLKGQGCPKCNGGVHLNYLDFVKRSKMVHGNKYTYEKAVYKDSKSKLLITCPIHGFFMQTPDNHLRGAGCPKCKLSTRRSLKLTLDSFKEKATQIHNAMYNYSRVNLNNNYSPVEIICPKHGSFWQSPYLHLRGCRCPKCANRVKLDESSFIILASKKHNNKYDYSLVKYVSNKTPVKIICPIHGVFEQRPREHLHGSGCILCSNEGKKLLKEDFVRRAMFIHGDKYDYLKVKYKNIYTKVEIICPKHGSFWQRPDQHLDGAGCPICSESKGERKVRLYLKKYKIPFIFQYKFDDCRNKLPLPFDFAIFNEDGSLKCLIEYQGEQHFESIDFFGGKAGLLNIQRTDKIKRDYCKIKNIPLYIISYLENIKEILDSIFKNTINP